MIMPAVAIPHVRTLENLIAKLEGGEVGLAFSSGLAAIDAVAKLLKAGDEIIAVDDIYGGAYRLFTQVYQQFGITINFVDTSESRKCVQRYYAPNKADLAGNTDQPYPEDLGY